MKKFLSYSVFALSLSMSMVAFAGDKPDQNPGQHPQEEISWEDFQRRCADAKGNFPHDQREIRDAAVTCTDTRREWVNAQGADIPLEYGRTITAEIGSDKFKVSPVSKYDPVAGQPGSCLRYKEIERTFSFSRKISCSELTKVGSLTELCGATLEKSKKEDPKGGTVHETGHVIDTCDNGNFKHEERLPKGEKKEEGKKEEGKKDDGKGAGKPL